MFSLGTVMFLIVYSASTLSFLSTMSTFSGELDQWTECIITGIDTACYEGSDKSMTAFLLCTRERSECNEASCSRAVAAAPPGFTHCFARHAPFS